jgi:DNA polymerase-3 subunit epsilon
MNSPPFVTEYFRSIEGTWTPETPVRDVRFVVLDSETTGLDPSRDRVITIGAVAVIGGEILLEDSFDELLQVEYNSSAVTVHGVTREESRSGLQEPEALARFLGYLKDGVIVGHHIGHDVEMLNAGYQRHWGFRLENLALDTMALTLHLERDGAFVGREEIREFSLDSLCTLFGVIPHDRHTAPGDAFITAQVYLRLLCLAAKYGRTSLARVAEPFEPSA